LEEQATAAARLVAVDYETTEALLDLYDSRGQLLTNPWGIDQKRGDVEAALAAASVRIEATYTTPEETTNPLGLFATVAAWDGDALTVHDTTQYPTHVRATLAAAFEVPESGVRVLVPFVGGIGMALLEETISDPGTGRIANATFGDYLVAVNADVPHMDVIFSANPTG
jgi:CO/xanthine dehydrogenase Mo-binding subunit